MITTYETEIQYKGLSILHSHRGCWSWGEIDQESGICEEWFEASNTLRGAKKQIREYLANKLKYPNFYGKGV